MSRLERPSSRILLAAAAVLALVALICHPRFKTTALSPDYIVGESAVVLDRG